MPTGYTYKVVDGTSTSLKEFALDCAKAFGALIELKDAPRDAKIPVKLDDSSITRARDSWTQASDRWKELQAYTETEWKKLSYNRWLESLESRRNYRLRNEQERTRVNMMLEKVRAWKAKYSPEDLKNKEKIEYFNFLEQQLTISYPYKLDDYEKAENDPIAPMDWETFRNEEIKRFLDEISYRSENLEETIEREEGKQKWIDDLRTMINEIEE